jgi:hypothetical protein
MEKRDSVMELVERILFTFPQKLVKEVRMMVFHSEKTPAAPLSSEKRKDSLLAMFL